MRLGELADKVKNAVTQITVTKAGDPVKTNGGEAQRFWVETPHVGFQVTAFRRGRSPWQLMPLGQDRARPFQQVTVTSGIPVTTFCINTKVWNLIQEKINQV